eukprot:INCI3641.1.p1 GENE.INCI3641.1~~INCI3641.1.p1  ORF type:complete len:355 (+),score=65.73 INCI3641.1:348-1412(+)
MLFAAAYSGDMEMAAHALEHKVDVDARHTKWEMTALHEAAQQGHENVLRLLLHCKASCFVRNKRGQTALEVALVSGESTCIDLLSDRMEEQKAEWAKHTRRRSEGMSPVGHGVLNRSQHDDQNVNGSSGDGSGVSSTAGVDDNAGWKGSGPNANGIQLPAVTHDRQSGTGKANDLARAEQGQLLPELGTAQQVSADRAQHRQLHRRSATALMGRLGKAEFAAALDKNDKLSAIATGSTSLYRRRPTFNPPPRRKSTVNVKELVDNARKEAETNGAGSLAMNMLSGFRSRPIALGSGLRSPISANEAKHDTKAAKRTKRRGSKLASPKSGHSRKSSSEGTRGNRQRVQASRKKRR